MTSNTNSTLIVENEDFKITIIDKGHTDLDVGNWCTMFRGALLAMTYHPNNENPCMKCEEDDCTGCVYEY